MINLNGFDILPIMAFVPGSVFSVIVFVTICFAILFAFIAAAASTTTIRSDSIFIVRRLSTVLGIYCVAIAAIVYSGIIERAFIPFGPLFIFATVAIAIALGFSPLGLKIAKSVRIEWLVAFQGFRLPLELVLHQWYLNGTIPKSMTWDGSNWDIVSGVLACFAFAFVRGRLWLAWTVNIVGIILLINVARVAIMSSPVPFGWNIDPPLELILYLPYAYIVPICVGGAAMGHVILTRRLLSKR